MTVTAASLKARYPSAFPASFSDVVLDAAIAEAYALNSASFWGSKLDQAVSLEAADLALLDAGAAAAAGGVKNAKAGSVAVTYMTPAELGSDGSKTSFRRQLERLTRSCGVAARTSRCL